MDFDAVRARAREIRGQYAAAERAEYGRSWTPSEIALGLVGDVGDLAKLVQGKAGVRPRADLDEALAHELADCLWAVLVLADCYDVDIEAAFTGAMDEIETNLRS
jgi:NTP pyrophosphatase (non-canonical NTP hydrolase)